MKIKLPLAITTVFLLIEVADYYLMIPVIKTVAKDLTVAILSEVPKFMSSIVSG
jgi:hypothetical protein